MNSSCIYYILQKELLILKSSSTGQLSRMGPQLVVFNVFFLGLNMTGLPPIPKWWPVGWWFMVISAVSPSSDGDFSQLKGHHEFWVISILICKEMAWTSLGDFCAKESGNRTSNSWLFLGDDGRIWAVAQSVHHIFFGDGHVQNWRFKNPKSPRSAVLNKKNLAPQHGAYQSGLHWNTRLSIND